MLKLCLGIVAGLVVIVLGFTASRSMALQDNPQPSNYQDVVDNFWKTWENSRPSEAIQRAARVSKRKISFAVARAARFSERLRFPIWRKAQLTPFLTMFLSSVAALLINGRKRRNAASFAVRSATVNPAIRENAARLTNSSRRPLHSMHLL